MTKKQKIWCVSLVIIFMVGVLIDGLIWGLPVEL